MNAFVVRHKKYIEWWKKKLNVSNYGIAWISFVKGLIIGLLIQKQNRFKNILKIYRKDLDKLKM